MERYIFSIDNEAFDKGSTLVHSADLFSYLIIDFWVVYLVFR